eukprot:JZ554744.1.p2 GENE.JZ554744.1~~JZ554744.1.p2  ORF type:complete len:62 (+),score=1.24 JZ554744.1:228-413(+)
MGTEGGSVGCCYAACWRDDCLRDFHRRSRQEQHLGDTDALHTHDGWALAMCDCIHAQLDAL